MTEGEPTAYPVFSRIRQGYKLGVSLGDEGGRETDIFC